MVGIAEVLIAAGAVAALAGGASKKLIKDKKARSAALVGGILVALVGLQMGGYFAFLTQAGTPPKAGSLFDAYWVTGDSDTDRTETESISVDQRTITYVMADAQMDGLGDVLMGADILNKNVGETTDLWSAQVNIVSIGTVIVSGIPTPVANYTTDRSRFNIAYTDDDASGTWTQVFDKFFSNDVVTGGAGSLSIDLPIDPAVADDVAAGGTFNLVYSVAGMTLTVVLQES
jgi:hypothetical protein